MNRILKVTVFLTILGLLLTACAPAGTTAQPGSTQAANTTTEQVLNVGFVAPYTGPNALVGQELKDIHTMAFEAINWKIGNYMA